MLDTFSFVTLVMLVVELFVPRPSRDAVDERPEAMGELDSWRLVLLRLLRRRAFLRVVDGDDGVTGDKLEAMIAVQLEKTL